MPQCQFLFSAIFLFQVLPKEIFSELDETKAEVPILLTQRQSPKGRRRRVGRRPHHRVAQSHLWSRHHMVWAPRVPSDIALLPINCLHTKTLNSPASIHENFRSAAAIEDQFWGTEVSVTAPCRDGELPPQPSSSTPPPSSSPLLTPMMRRE
jgi:hypothetical protein